MHAMFRLSGLICLSAAVLLAGCTPETLYDLYNNSGSSITINNCEGDKFILPNASGAIFACDPDQFAILANERKWTYTLARLPKYFDAGQYVRTRVRLGNRMTLQLEPDGAILAVRVDAVLPVVGDHPQPPGFPLVPGRMELLR